MSWKSALIIAAALALATLLRTRSPADRAAVLRLGVSLVLMLPVIALFLPALQVEMAAEPVAPMPVETWTGAETAPLEIAALQPVPATIWDDPSSLIGILYLGGLFMVALRIGAGLLTLSRWTRAASPVTNSVWLSAFERVRPAGRAGERIRFLLSDDTPAPLSWGWLKPVVLVDRDTLEREEDAEAILAHEIAHIVRRDWPALMMTRTAVALFWFNPLVWLLERELVQQAEEAADCSALVRVEATQYAQTLVSCAQHGRGPLVPANSMAPRASGLKRRVHAILDGRASMKSGSFWTLAAMLGCAGFAAPLAAIELVPAVAELVEPEAPEAVEAPEAPLAPIARPAAASAPAAPAPLAALAPVAAAAPARAPAPPRAPDGEVIEIPAIDVDVPEQRIHVPAVKVDVDGVRVHVPAMNVVAPRVKVNVPPIKVHLPNGELAPLAFAFNGAHMQGWSAEDRAEFEREMREVRREVHRETREAAREARAEARTERIKVRHDRDAARRGMLHGAKGMEKGAEGMVHGARKMEEEARKLQSRDYRAQQIARAAAEGRTLTHQELIDAIPKLRQGARKMIAGAEKMRASAARMRAQGHN
jgi:beta-lactamase regulating signal transducer with metallopeptidase domain